MGTSIYPVSMGIATIYALKSDGVILVDGGDPKAIGKLKTAMKIAFIDPGEIRLIVLTHGHWDHIGSVQDIKNWTGAKVMLHQGDKHYIHEVPPSQPSGLTRWGRFLIGLIKAATTSVHIEPFEVELVAGDEDVSLLEYGIPGKVIFTPGHSWGSTSVLLDHGEAFVGDLAMNAFPMRFSPGLPIFGDDIAVVKKSLRKLLDLGAKTIYPAHGKPFPIKALEKMLA